MSEQAHRITVDDVTDLGWQMAASATTADRTQRKRLDVAVGEAAYRVTRRYFQGGDPPDVIYHGRDLAEAVRIYNLLS